MLKLKKEARSELAPNPDDLLMARIKRVLKRSGYATLSQIRVFVVEGEVFLEGQVPTYFVKQMAQTLILSLEEVKDLNNDLVVETHVN